MDADDTPIGRLLSRREVLSLVGAAGAALLLACSGDDDNAPAAGTTPAGTTSASDGQAAASANVPACVVRPEETEGPYFVDEKLNRSDIRSDPSNNSVKAGLPLELTFTVGNLAGNSCNPLAGATVDVWHCDALGVYSDVQDQGFNTVGQKFLRGYQNTDANGVARFTTIYPGWYQGRAVHIHFKIRSGGKEFTSQLFFDDALSLEVYGQAPYSQKGTAGITKNASDAIYRTGGDKLLLKPTKSGQGYAATFDIAVSA